MAGTTTQLRPLASADASACDAIVRSLPYHFGDPIGRAECARAVRSQDGLVALCAGEVSGFITWKRWFDSACEITWLAVQADRRGSGIGTSLVEEVVTMSRRLGARFLVVTTLSESVAEDAVADGYAATRAFYHRRGFVPLWEPSGWWSPESQALLMLRPLS